MKTAALLSIVFLSLLAAAQENHKFWDAQNKVGFAVTAGIRTVDIVESCRNLHVGGREQWIPAQSCAGVATWIASGQVTQTGLQYFAHKRKWHQLERWLPFVMVSPNVIGIGYTFSHQGKNLPSSTVDQFGCVRSYSPRTGWLTDCSHAHP